MISGFGVIFSGIGGPVVFENVSSEPLKSASHAPPVETAASSCLRRCCALAGLEWGCG